MAFAHPQRTFYLATHTWHEPFDRITPPAKAKAMGVAVTIPCMGEPLNLRQPHAGSALWLAVDGQVELACAGELPRKPGGDLSGLCYDGQVAALNRVSLSGIGPQSVQKQA